MLRSPRAFWTRPASSVRQTQARSGAWYHWGLMRLRDLALALFAVGLTVVADAQVRTAFPDKRGLKLTDFPRVVKLADNVYGYEEIRNPGFTTVSLFVVGADGVLVANGDGRRQGSGEPRRHRGAGPVPGPRGRLPSARSTKKLKGS